MTNILPNFDQCWQGCLLFLWIYAFTTRSFASAVLLFNISWFGSAVLFFTFLGDLAMRWLVPQDAPKKWYNKVKGATAFLGGMNGAMLGLSIMFSNALGGELFQHPDERAILFTSFAIGHFSQFIINVPSFLVSKGVLEGRKMDPMLKKVNMKWQELTWIEPDSMMFFIFVVDFLGFVVNLRAAMMK